MNETLPNAAMQLKANPRVHPPRVQDLFKEPPLRGDDDVVAPWRMSCGRQSEMGVRVHHFPC